MKKVLIVLAIIIIAIQFIPLNRTNPPVKADFDGPAEIKSILKRACYNCHSNETVWPWYSYVAPVSFLVASDVNEAREHLNFSNWGNLSRKKQVRYRGGIWEMISKEEMPPWQYKIMHPEASLSQEDKNLMKGWSGE